MGVTLTEISNELAETVQKMAEYVVSIRARRHYPSSGLRWGADVIVTANHTVRRDEEIAVSLAGGATVEASLVGRDPGTDLAVLKVKESGPFASDHLAAEEIKVGDVALLVGRSPDSGVNASFGIISAASGRWRTWAGGQLDSYIRLDARMFPQSSGAAVVNGRGQMIGIATSGLSRIAGLAIPTSTIKTVTEKLLERGFVPRGYAGIGVQMVPLSSGLRQNLSIANRSGLIVLTVDESGPADKAGILPGDILLSADDVTLRNTEDLQDFLMTTAMGKTSTLKYVRGGTLNERSIVIGERPGRRN